MLVFSGLIIATGFASLVVALLTTSPGSIAFWAWMGGTVGCIIGGAGALAGCWNTLRQLQGAENLMNSPRWTWLDRALLVYGSLGAITILAGLIFWSRLNGTSLYGLLLLGNMFLFQGALFMIIRGRLRRAARHGGVAMVNGPHGTR
jgi:hypothetical protein